MRLSFDDDDDDDDDDDKNLDYVIMSMLQEYAHSASIKMEDTF